MKPREIPSMQQRGAPALASAIPKPSNPPLASSASRAGIAIEKGIPLPSGVRAAGLYPFGDMAPGDSFFVACTGDAVKRKCVSVSSASRAWRDGVEKDWKFAVRPVEGGMRCWRTK